MFLGLGGPKTAHKEKKDRDIPYKPPYRSLSFPAHLLPLTLIMVSGFKVWELPPPREELRRHDTDQVCPEGGVRVRVPLRRLAQVPKP